MARENEVGIGMALAANPCLRRAKQGWGCQLGCSRERRAARVKFYPIRRAAFGENASGPPVTEGTGCLKLRGGGMKAGRLLSADRQPSAQHASAIQEKG